MPKIIGGSLTEHRERTRIKLFAALATLMLERGFDAISLADIAAKAGVGRTAVYNHFPDKEALLLAYMTYETEEYVANLEDALHGIDDPVEQMRTYVRRQAQLKRVYRLSPGPDLRSVVSPATQRQLRSHAELVATVLRRILEGGMADGSFAEQPLNTTVSLVNACLSTRATADGDPDAVAATEEFVLRALGAQVSVTA
ncbi:TetR/AcrR family transcriptional regulator [Actinotalea sp. M2MS4P-6]|uniref:TetR/AcrR family transcriptional regulator n=1 Tax=Actinotalea sp. M2MS4P-6 TaxID=2983762 RepID=UPI0021E379E3|nr:TetR/AcrR family transcriptional regulator [Actinotalea sp. M2MS4P-6]MCV2392940.1 TetR/AcrR family transcriptional regulator [Actinotalea sp. M2MS4P-6]